MKRIAILTCLEACRVCAGVSCLQAWNEKSAGFAQYQGQETQLVAFLHCNGCTEEGFPDRGDPAQDPGMVEKVDRLQAIGVDRVHYGVCTLNRETGAVCPTIEKILQMLRERGMETVYQTH